MNEKRRKEEEMRYCKHQKTREACVIENPTKLYIFDNVNKRA